MTKYSIIRGRRIRAAIVGCGRISKNHFESIKKHRDDVDLISICDNDDQVLLDFVGKYNVNAYLSLEEMLKKEYLDLVIICTPSGLHAMQAELCALYGVNVMTEKPMATTWKDGLRMVSTCKNSNVRLFVVKQNRKNSTLQLLKRAIDEGRFGKIKLVQINVFWTRPQEYYDQSDWRGTWELDGGAFMNQASHYVDLLDWLIGPIDKIQAFTSTSRNIEAEDTGVLNIKWADGALGSMSVTMLTFPKNFEGSLTILGENGTVRIGGLAVNEIQHWKFNDQKDYDSAINQANYETSSVYGFGHPLYYKNVIETLQGYSEPEIDGTEGLKSLEVLIAAYRSARDEIIIELPLEYEN